MHNDFILYKFISGYIYAWVYLKYKSYLWIISILVSILNKSARSDNRRAKCTKSSTYTISSPALTEYNQKGELKTPEW